MNGIRLAIFGLTCLASGVCFGLAIFYVAPTNNQTRKALDIAEQWQATAISWQALAERNLTTAQEATAALTKANNTSAECLAMLRRTTTNLEHANATLETRR